MVSETTKKQLTISILLNGTNSLIFLYYIYNLLYTFKTLKYLTMLSYCANSISLLICLYCDIMLYYTNSSNLENDYKLIKEPQNDENIENNGDSSLEKLKELNDWNRNKFSVICNTFSYFVTISYWLLVSMGKKFIGMDRGLFAFINTLYLHLIITILVIIDIFNSQRKKLQFSWDYYWIIAGLFLAYCVFNYIEKYTYDKNVYPFMHNSFMLLVFFVGLGLILLYFCYLNHIYLLRFK